MKIIKNTTQNSIKTKDVILAVLKGVRFGTTGISPEEMKERIRLIDQVSSSEDEISLEDKDYEFIKSLVNQPVYEIVNADLSEILDGILNS